MSRDKRTARRRKPLAMGRRVKVTRINGEEARGVIVKGPIEHLIQIGEFYLVGRAVAEEAEPAYRGSARKSRARIRYEEHTGAIGMYERAEIRLI